MNIKKKLKEERKKVDEKILAEGQDLYNELVNQYCTSKTNQTAATNKTRKKWYVAVSCFVVVCLVVGVSVVLTRPASPEYLSQNEISVNSTLEEFQTATNSAIGFSEGYSIFAFVRIDDSVTSDTLCYQFSFMHNENFILGELYVVVNNYYKFDEKHLGDIQNSKLGLYDMKYSAKESIVEDVPTNEYFGCINIPDYKLYFSFQELHLDDSMSPLPVLESLLILK